MKILFAMVAPPELQPENCSDYQLDTLLHGLVKNGHTIHTFHDHWWMYESEKKARPQDFAKIWGKGFTVYGNLSDEEKRNIQTVSVDSINGTSYDAVIVGLHHTNAGNDQVLLKFITYICTQLGIESRQVIVVDGWDRPYVNKYIASNTKYFKRELYPEHEQYCLPISFAFPEEKIRPQCVDTSDVVEVSKHLFKYYGVAPLIPVNQSVDPSFMSTYKYDTEEEYYEMYRNSEFALTSKKGGWDTMRHYEIIANGCLPIFVDIERCPPKTLHLFPKDVCIAIKEAKIAWVNYKDGVMRNPGFEEDCSFANIDNPGNLTEPCDLAEGQRVNRLKSMFQQQLSTWLREKGTTKYLAEYVLRCSL